MKTKQVTFKIKKCHLIIFIILLILSITILFTSYYKTGNGMVLSMSSDGRYAIETTDKNYAILWDISRHKKSIISNHANMYSAYWVKNSSYYLWQSLSDKVVHVIDNSSGQEVKTFKPVVLVYGEALSSNLKNYVVSDWNWSIYLYQHNQRYQLAKMFTSGTFEGANKLINFTFLNNNKILASGMAYPTGDLRWGPSLFDLIAKKTMRKYLGNMVQTFATISPDGKYVVAGDGNGANLFVWDRNTGKKIYRGVNIFSGKLLTHGSDDESKLTYDDSKLIKVPKAFDDSDAGMEILSIKFIDQTEYLVFYMYSHYAVLYSVTSPWPIKYLNLGASPKPAMDYYERDESIDSSPSTHTLVVAKEHEPGIMVYHYNPNTKTLKKIWDAS
jgi:WD40 repeat protein